MLLGAFALVGCVVATLLVDAGEVATLTTFDDEGRGIDTRLWVVDMDGSTYVRATTEAPGWVERLEGRPEVRLKRSRATILMRAFPLENEPTRLAVNDAMLDKYGAVARLWHWMADGSDFRPVRLDPITASKH